MCCLCSLWFVVVCCFLFVSCCGLGCLCVVCYLLYFSWLLLGRCALRVVVCVVVCCVVVACCRLLDLLLVVVSCARCCVFVVC